ncbi:MULTISPECIES: lectin MOA-related protein [Okeania]|uniref:Agglutinin C-terminal domain-containing protein n=2 Tax=Okeania TaxID=1458928 RepID=A0A3N6NEW9_9CYAN|nr:MULTISPECIES: lectin MOA-related protein [Okeania]NEP06717.1 hypothetical protein [Okeania sp. SIO4D6]NEP40695.1 hypothetical protein [Okeania sp. SIO2H7]NEP73600.1 hypothetical protein [Okeania sp. SIO2G5]NEP94250.1 hypothetical protein [Okeania sp. SIO2F5]NEQ93217.1 hypothetical protein [Okeania sp. SIO2G4]NET13566.1 hypothetical protein [Okeania sp. SIO1H6]
MTIYRFDCDDFALLLKADFAKNSYQSNNLNHSHAFGILWGNWINNGGHAINWMINEDCKLRLIEPQNDNVFFPNDPDGELFSHIYFMFC